MTQERHVDIISTIKLFEVQSDMPIFLTSARRGISPVAAEVADQGA